MASTGQSGVGDQAYLFFLGGETLAVVKGEFHFQLAGRSDAKWKDWLPELGEGRRRAALAMMPVSRRPAKRGGR